MCLWTPENRDCRALLNNLVETSENHNGNRKEIQIAKKVKNKHYNASTRVVERYITFAN